MMNKIKLVLLIPEKLQLSNVSTIYKGKGSKRDVINLRGIFKLPIVRNILDKLVYYEDQEVICKGMGQFQVGNHRKRSIRDHSLVVHAVINDARTFKISIDLQFFDIKQCFDSIWLQEGINDLYDSGVQSRNLNLLYEGNKATQMCVETSFGKSERVHLTNVVMQGSVSGGTICSNQISKLCNKSHNGGNVYLYHGVAIPSLAMVDDIVNIAHCNTIQSMKNNIETDECIKIKKLEGQVGDGKCQWLHVGKDECNSSYVINGDNTTRCTVYKYLGDHVSDGWDALYGKRHERAQGYAVVCQAMCTEISLGYQLISIAKLLHDAIFLNGSMVNMETWPHCTASRIAMFEKAEQGFFRRILGAHSKTAIEALYLELGIIPFRFQLMMRRIKYFHDIMNRNDEELTKQVVLVQMDKKTKGDFYNQVEGDLQTLKIDQEAVVFTSKDKLKELLQKQARTAAFHYLIELAETHSKVNTTAYTDLNGMAYMNHPQLTPDLVNLIFKFRTRMYNVKNNFRNNYKQSNTKCPLCTVHDDSQQHLFECSEIRKQLPNLKTKHDDIFSSDIDSMIAVGKELKEIVDVREDLVSELLSSQIQE